VITIDAGGTSLDVGLVRGALTDTSLTSDVARYRIGVPMVNIETLGAGGGSIAWFDDRGILSVGPQSAESRPGPACYDLGGVEPTTTDAQVVLGWFSQTALLGGEMPINADAAFAAIEAKIAARAGLSVGEAAEGIIRVATNNMVGGIRRISVERGYDPRDAVLVAIGGSGPAYGCRIAEELEMDTVVVPRVASGFCAFGAALSEVKHDYVATYSVELEDLDLNQLNTILASMETRGRRELERDGVDPHTVEVRRAFEMRYVDQVHNCLVTIDLPGAVDQEGLVRLREAFDRRHEELYTYSEPDNTAMLINVHTSVIGNALSTREQELFTPALGDERPADADTSREIYIGSRRVQVTAPVVGVDQVASADDGIRGPCVVEEKTTTIVVLDGWRVTVDPRGHYEIRRDKRAAQ
jgi:N-methylhydantoinase A